MYWIKVDIAIAVEAREALSAWLFTLGCSGCEEIESGIRTWFEADTWSDEKKQRLSAFGAPLAAGFSEKDIRVSRVPAENWNEKWKENFKTFRVGESIIVQPDWEKCKAAEGETLITIAPKMAFGTGHHETTKLILQILEKLALSGRSVLDAGTGSGILAIYAALRAATAVDAFDNDPQAIENAAENRELNGVAEKVNLYTGELNDMVVRNYDIIVANINRNVLLELAAAWEGFIHEGSRLVLSGLLRVDRPAVQEAYAEKGWKTVDVREEGEWSALCLQRV